jgi:SNF2 family DNA or RNA helicase
MEKITEQINPLVLQLSAEDYLQMPELLHHTLPVTLPPKVMNTYREMEDVYYAKIEEKEIVASTAAVASGKLRQIANGALYTEAPQYIELHDEKLSALESLLEELNGHSVLILYDFRHDAERIRIRFPNVVDISSVTDETNLTTIVNGFNDGHIRHLCGHPASMGHGLNLQGRCHHVVWFGIPWNLEYYDQAIARVYRQGQKASKVHVYHVTATGTIDERVVKTLQKKDRTQEELLQSLIQPLDL